MAPPIAQASPTREKATYPKFAYHGGRFVYKKWVRDENGSRIAQRCYRKDSPDLQSTYLYNQDGSEVLRYIRIDVDANKTLSIWKDVTGAVDWTKIATELRQNHPGINSQIEYVTRSQSKQGIHILMGLASLPLTDKTFKAQNFARKIQSNLIDIFNELGIGADRGGKGLKQDFSTYRNPENIIHANPILTRRIEKSAHDFGSQTREKFLNQLNKACEESLETVDLKNGYRLYPDLRLETKIARLFLFTMGMHRPVINTTVFERQNAADDDFNTFHATPNSVELSLDQIAEVMNTEKKNIYGKFWDKEEIQRLFHIEKTIDGTIKITVKDSKKLHKRIQRALAIWNYERSVFKLNLIPPELVTDGNRNSTIVSWVLALKWHGVSSDTALIWLTELVKSIPGYEGSSSCKKTQLRATVQSIYRNRREMEGFRFCEFLPEWLDPSNLKMTPKERKTSSKKETPINLCRSILSPSGVVPHVAVLPLPFIQECFSHPLSERFSPFHLTSSLFQEESVWASDLCGEATHCGSTKSNFQKMEVKEKIRVVSYKNRIGFFYEGKLILCLIKNRHYKLTPAINHIEEKILHNKIKINPIYDVIHVKHNSKSYKFMANQLYHEETFALRSQFICGDKLRYHESLEIYDTMKAQKEGISLDEYRLRFTKYQKSNVEYSILEKEVNDEILF